MSFLNSFRSFLRDAPWHLWTSQLAGVLSIELKKNLLRRRSVWIYFVAFAPVRLIGAHAFHSPGGIHCSIEQDTRMMVMICQGYYLRLGLFFACMGLFHWISRCENLEKTLN